MWIKTVGLTSSDICWAQQPSADFMMTRKQVLETKKRVWFPLILFLFVLSFESALL